MNASRRGPKVHEHVSNIVSTFWKGDAVKGVVLSAIVSSLIYMGHIFLQGHDQQSTLDQHTKQIEALETTAKLTSESVQQLAVTSTRIEGKLDTLSTKIDDDRRAARINDADARNRASK